MRPVAEGYSPDSSQPLHELLTISFSGCSPATKKKKKKKILAQWRPKKPLQWSVRGCLGGRRGGGQGTALEQASPPLRGPAAASHLAPAAPQAGGPDLPPQRPPPGREARGEAAGPAGRIFPPRRRRRRRRYHGDRGGRPGLAGSPPPSAQRRAVCRLRHGAAGLTRQGALTEPGDERAKK